MAAEVANGVDAHGVYHNKELGISFKTPAGLTDVTAKANESADKDPKAVQLLLFELSGPNANDPEWRGLAVQSYARNQVATKDDAEAEAKLTRTVIGNKPTEEAPAEKVTLGGRPYLVSHFQKSGQFLTQHIEVYATVIKGQMVAFVFTANSAANLDAMAETMKTLK